MNTHVKVLLGEPFHLAAILAMLPASYFYLIRPGPYLNEWESLYFVL